VALLAQGLLGKGAGHVMVEDDEGVITPGLAAVSSGLLLHGLGGEPILGFLPGNRDHRRDQDEQFDRKRIGNQRSGVAAE